MKWKSLFLIGMGGCLFASCTDEVPTEMCTPALRSVTATMSPMYDWEDFTMLHDVEVRVVVTLYPKASEFNSAPIKMVRTYTPVFIGDKTLAKGVDPAQGALIPGLSN